MVPRELFPGGVGVLPIWKKKKGKPNIILLGITIFFFNKLSETNKNIFELSVNLS